MSNYAAEVARKLTHDPTNAQIGNSVVISPSNLYRRSTCRPISIEVTVQYPVVTSGEAPDYLTVGEVLEFVFDCLVAIGTTLYNLADVVRGREADNTIERLHIGHTDGGERR